MSPAITVVIPAYNRAHCIRKAVRSVADQRFPGIEVVVVDDGSSDGTAAAVSGTAWGIDVRLVRHERNLGASAARNTGISEARGRYVAFLDSDDIWKRDKLSRQLAFMHQHGLRASCTGFSVARGTIGSRPVSRPYAARIGLEEFVWGCYTSPGTTLLAERALLKDLGGYDTGYARLEDWDLLLRLGLAGETLGYLDEDLATINPAGPPSFASVQMSVERLRNQFHKRLRAVDPVFARNFLAALDFEMAAAAKATNRWVGFFGNLARSLVRVPRGHRSAEIILRPRLRAWRNGS